VLSPVTLSLRAPVAGTLMIENADPGRILAAGALFGQVRDAMADETRLTGLRARVQALETEAAAMLSRLAAAEGEIEVAGTRSGAFQEARLRQLRARLDESRASEAAPMVRLREASSAIRRGERLVGKSAIAPAAVDQLTRNQRVAEREVTALQERRRALQAEHDAAAISIFTFDNATDRSVSQQTEDRLRLLRAELRAQIAERRGQPEIVRGQLAIKQRGFEARSKVPLPAPAQARVLALHAQNREFVSQGQEIAPLLDCGQQMVLAAVTERVFTRIATGQCAEFRPQAGSDASLRGEVVRLLSPIGTSAGGLDTRYRVKIRMDRQGAKASFEGARSGSVTFLSAAP
jgi:multidrug resistance efflux pump